MTKNKKIDFSKSQVKTALSKMLEDNEVARHGELKETDDGYTFTYSQFGTTTVSIALKEADTNATDVDVNFDVATTHKIVLTDDNINKHFEKYSSMLVEKYLV